MGDHEIAGLLAQEAGEVLLAVLEEGRDAGWALWQFQTHGDQRAHDHLMSRLAELRPHDAVLSEEGSDDGTRLGVGRVWIIDPLDGTRDFGRPGSMEWAVHVALVEDGVPTAGAVSLPPTGRLFGTDVSAVRLEPERYSPVVITSRSQLGEAEEVAAAIGGVVRSCGSAGVKAMAVVSGAADVYVHPSGLYEWDACAPAAVARSTGLDVSGIDGSLLEFNKPRPVVPGLVVSRPEYTTRVLGALGW